MRKRKSEKTAVQKELKTFLELIAPSVMDFRHPNYFVIGNTFRCVWAIRSYPTITTDQAILRELGEKDGVTLHIYTQTIGTLETNDIFKKAERRNRHQRFSSKNMQAAREAEDNINDLSDLISKMHRSKEPLIYCAVYIELIASTLESLEMLKGNVIACLNRYKLLYDSLWLQQKQGFHSVKPCGQNTFGKQFERVLPVSSVANLFPFSYSGKTDPKGIYIGRDANGSNIITDFDQRSQDKTNGHILILGNSGEGKSYLTKLLLTNLCEMGKRLYIIDPEHEYMDLCKTLGGTTMDMMSGEYMINVLEPRLWASKEDAEDSPNEEPAAFRKSTRLNQHIAFLRDFFASYKDFTSAELDTLEIMLAKLYKEFNITDSTDFDNLSSMDYPILSDLHNLLLRELKDLEYNKKKEKTLYTPEILRSLTLGLNSICDGAESVFFSGHTNIPTADFIVFGVKNMLSTNQNLKNAMYFNILSYMANKFLTEGNTVASTDEFHEILKNPTALSYLRSFLKRGRKKNSNMILTSQNPNDFFLPDIVELTKPLLSIPTHKFLFFPGNCDEQEYIRVMGLTPSEYDIIRFPNKGHCLYLCGNERYHHHIIAPEYKSKLFGTAGGV